MKRFGATRASHAIEHLSDNGSAYIARETRLFAQALNLAPCFTPVASPQSNGVSEDYNEIHPHSALKMASPRQFIGAKSN